MANNIQIILSSENIKEAESILKFIGSMDGETQKSFYQFLQGVKFGQSLAKQHDKDRIA